MCRLTDQRNPDQSRYSPTDPKIVSRETLYQREKTIQHILRLPAEDRKAVLSILQAKGRV